MKRRVEEEVNSERWLISYADFITLLFAFFVVMYSISSLNEGKYKILAESLESIFTEETRSVDPIQVGEIVKFEKNIEEYDERNFLEDKPTFEVFTSQVETWLEAMIEEGKIFLHKDKDWVELVLDSDLLFVSGSALPKPSAYTVIKKLATVFGKFDNHITVEGFTDSVPIFNDIFPSNWELAVMRAGTIVRILTEQGVAGERLAAVGYGKNFPIADNRTPKGRTRNRRVVFLISRHDLRKEKLARQTFVLPHKAVPLVAPERPTTPAGSEVLLEDVQETAGIYQSPLQSPKDQGEILLDSHVRGE